MEQTGDIITFTQFEEGDILNKARNDAESGDKYDDDSIIPSLISKEEIYAMDSGDESNNDIISTDMIEDMRGGIKSHRNLNQRESRYKIRDSIRQYNWNGKEH